MNFYKRDTLNDKFEEFANRFQLKLDEQNIAHKTHIQKLDDKIAKLETENSRTYELVDKLYEYRFNEISCHINHQVSECNIRIDNTFKTLHEGLQKVMLLTKEKITIITDKVEICMNEIKQINILNNNQKEMSIEIKNINNKFDKDIHKLTTQQQVTTENIDELNQKVSEINDEVTSIYEISISDIKNNISLLEDKLEDKQWSNCYDLKIITEDIVKLKEKQSLTDDVLLKTNDVLLDIQNDIILINNHSKIENTSQQIFNNEFSEKIKILTDNVSNIQNIQNINNKFDREIHTLTTQQHLTTENLNALQQHINTWSCIITDNLEICMNAIKLINVSEEPMFAQQMTQRGREIYNAANNRYLGTSIISLDEPRELSYINQFYNLKVLVINNWSVFNYGIFDYGSKADNFKMMRDRYGEMNNKTLETFIIHCAYDFKTWNNPYDQETSTPREPLLLEYLCMQFKNFPSLKIVKLYYLDLPLNIEDIIINNLENMRHTIKELHIISNTIQASRLKMYCNNKKIVLNQLILSKDKSVEAFQRDVITPLNKKRIDEDGGYMRRTKNYSLK